ncbi:MAG: type II toxin-antitoxin system RelE/ParE family toxin [Bacteroidota bacterium]
MAKRYNLVISEEAAEDIEAIRDFGEARKKGLGFKYLEDILDCIEAIQHNPQSFQYYKTPAIGIRRGLSKQYSIIVLYDLDQDRDRIEILTIADSRQDWQ